MTFSETGDKIKPLKNIPKNGKHDMTETYMPAFKDLDEMQTHHVNGLKLTVNHAYHGSSFYKKKLDDLKIQPDDINSLEDIEKLPFTKASDLRDVFPLRFCQ